MFLPPGVVWPTWHWWCSLKVSDQAAWASAIATLMATALALTLALREGVRRRSEAVSRGKVALALLYPELARLAVVLKAIENLLTTLLAPDGGGLINPPRVEKIIDAAKQLTSPAVQAGMATFIDMPPRFRFNLPSALQKLPAITSIAENLRLLCSSNNVALMRSTAQTLLSFTTLTLADVDAANGYVKAKLVPEQTRHMRKVLSSEQLAAVFAPSIPRDNDNEETE